MSPKHSIDKSDPSIVTDTTTREPIRILRKPDPEMVSKQLDELKSKGVKSVAVAFVHSYLWGNHEDMVAKMAKEKGFAVSVSSELQPMVSVKPPLPALATSFSISVLICFNRSSWLPEQTRPLPMRTSLPSPDATSSPSELASRAESRLSGQSCCSCSPMVVFADGTTFQVSLRPGHLQ